MFDTASPIAIESLLIQAIEIMVFSKKTKEGNKPAWVHKLKDLLHSGCTEKLSLTAAAAELNIHPVYLCQQFPLFFNCSLGDYTRMLRVEKAVEYMLKRDDMSLTEITYHCGFADQSHFIRTFKNKVGVTPFNFRKYLP